MDHSDPAVFKEQRLPACKQTEFNSTSMLAVSQSFQFTCSWKILQTTAARWIAHVACALRMFGLKHYILADAWVIYCIGIAHAKAVTGRCIVGGFFHAHHGTQLRFGNGRIVVAKINHVARGILAKEIASSAILPLPWLLEVVGYSFCRHLDALTSISRTTPLFGMRRFAFRCLTTISHNAILYR